MTRTISVDPGGLVPLGALRYESPNADATAAFGTLLAALLEDGDVIVLEGDLGAGKTTLTQGVAEGLGVKDAVTSPTFTLLQTYPGDPVDLNHLDLYRLEDEDELQGSGVLDAVGETGASLIEWGGRFAGAFGDDVLTITIDRAPLEEGQEEPARIISLEPEGAGAWSIARSLEELVLGSML